MLIHYYTVVPLSRHWIYLHYGPEKAIYDGENRTRGLKTFQKSLIKHISVYLISGILTFHPFSADLFISLQALCSLYPTLMSQLMKVKALCFPLAYSWKKKKTEKNPEKNTPLHIILWLLTFCSCMKHLWGRRADIKVVLEKWSQREMVFWKRPQEKKKRKHHRDLQQECNTLYSRWYLVAWITPAWVIISASLNGCA